MLLHLLPEARSFNYDVAGYLAFYRYARSVFREYAPHVAFVFTVFEADVLDSLDYYPGDAYVDWIGLNLFLPIDPVTGDFDDAYLNRLDALYFTFQNNKPLIVTLAVSHFTTADHSYHLHEAGKQIKSLYSKLLNNYARVKAIVYYDLNSVLFPTPRHTHDNFAITANHLVMDYYVTAISDPRFVELAHFTPDVVQGTLFLRSPFRGLRLDHTILIPKNTLVYDLAFDLSAVPVDLSDYTEVIRGHLFYSLDVLRNLGLQIHVDEGYRSVVFG